MILSKKRNLSLAICLVVMAVGATVWWRTYQTEKASNSYDFKALLGQPTDQLVTQLKRTPGNWLIWENFASGETDLIDITEYKFKMKDGRVVAIWQNRIFHTERIFPTLSVNWQQRGFPQLELMRTERGETLPWIREGGIAVDQNYAAGPRGKLLADLRVRS